ncbi:hypothetical protein [Methylopila sp. 73B]|uniref:hypothetical protein n=1 Tax=Methylopila sp. 73B TaxID=1120792 RepID=UPI00036044B5|nr:hypothetical protein [Methylopila sp. 73B]
MSIAQKRRAKIASRGRNRMQGPREPNGRIDRKWLAEQRTENEKMESQRAIQRATEARQRVFGLSASHAAQAEASTVLGRLWLAYDASKDYAMGIDRDQYDAAMRYQTIRNCYQRAKGIAPDYTEPRPEEGGGGDEVSYEDWAVAAAARYDGMVEVVDALCVSHRTPAPKEALRLIVLADQDIPELVGSLRLVLNALAKHFSGQKAMRPEMAA